MQGHKWQYSDTAQTFKTTAPFSSVFFQPTFYVTLVFLINGLLKLGFRRLGLCWSEFCLEDHYGRWTGLARGDYVPLVEFIYLVFTHTPGGIHIGYWGLCCCVPCLSSAIIFLCLLIFGLARDLKTSSVLSLSLSLSLSLDLYTICCGFLPWL